VANQSSRNRVCNIPSIEPIQHSKLRSARWPCFVMACVAGMLVNECVAHATTRVMTDRTARVAEGTKTEFRQQRVAQQFGNGFEVAEISGPAGKPIPVTIRVPDIEGGVYNYLMFQNLPKTFEMSAGFPVEESWVVPLDGLPNLTMKAPADFRGSFQLEIKLRIGGTKKSETRQVQVEVLEPGAQLRSAETVTSTINPRNPVSPETERAMLERADDLLDTRDVAGARMIYSHLAKRDSGKAAFGLARTYDPAFLEEIGIAGMDAADIDQAQAWYERAALLGHKDAQERLKVLAAGRQ